MAGLKRVKGPEEDRSGEIDRMDGIVHGDYFK